MKIHLMGIGGISMSGLAQILLKEGYTVTGSDRTKTDITRKLEELGVKIQYNHEAELIKGADSAIYTAAVKQNEPEFKFALENNILCEERAVFIGQLMQNYKNTISVAGTHGKTTTTSMLAKILKENTKNPTIMLGGELKDIGGNILVGEKEYFLTEACEYVESFLHFKSSMGIILNIEEDHLDYFRDLRHIIASFNKFSNICEKIVVNSDDENALRATSGCDRITFGKSSDFKIKIINPSRYTIEVDKKTYPINLKISGEHNIYNSAAAFTAAFLLNIPVDNIINSLENYGGVGRRFEKVGTFNGFLLIDDYAHHPTEIKASLKAAKSITEGEVWCIFQPHTYTRTAALFEDFKTAFKDADNTVITEVYAAREVSDGTMSGKILSSAIPDSIYIKEFNEIKEYIIENAKAMDTVVVMGAGDIFKVKDLIVSG